MYMHSPNRFFVLHGKNKTNFLICTKKREKNEVIKKLPKTCGLKFTTSMEKVVELLLFFF